LAELVTLAAALDTAPITLLYPGPYRQQVRVGPKNEMPEIWGAQWFSGLVFGISDVPYFDDQIVGTDNDLVAMPTPNIAAYDRRHRELRPARQRLEFEERRNALRRNLAKQSDPEVISQMVDEVADLQRRIDEIEAESDRLVAENDGGT